VTSRVPAASGIVLLRARERMVLASSAAVWLLVATDPAALAQQGMTPQEELRTSPQGEVPLNDATGPTAVFERPRPAYDAKGIDLGGFRLFPTLSVDESYDDNIFAEDSDEEDDFITAVTAGLVAKSEWSRHEVEIEAAVRHEKYLKNDDQDRTDYIVRPTVNLDLGGRDSAKITAEHSKRTIGRDDPEDSGDEDPTEIYRFAGGGEYIKRVNRLFFGFNANARRDDYISSGDSDLDRNEYRFGLPVGYEVSAMTDVVLEPFVRRRDFDEEDSTGADRDAWAGGATVGIDTEVTSLLHVNFDVGFVANDFDDSSFDDSIDLIFGGEAIWYVTPLTTVKGRAERRDIATNQPGSSSKTQSSLGLELQHELQQNLLLGGQLRYINDDFRDVDRTDDRLVAGVGVEYLLNRNFSLTADYQYQQRWSDRDGEDFSRNLVMVGLKTRF
jgi:hypothetical protein